MRLRSLALAAVFCLVAGCGRFANPTLSPSTTPSPPLSPSPAARTPSPRADPTLPRIPTYVAPDRDALAVAETTQLLVGRLAADGRYEVIAAELGAGNPPAVIGAIPNLEARLPDGLRVIRHPPAAVSATGFLVVPVGRVVVDEGDTRLAIFDLAAPDAPPWLLEASQFRLVGDRLWVVSGESELDVYDLPHRGPKILTLPAGQTLVRDDVVPFFLTEAGDAVLLEAQGVGEPVYSILRVDAVAPPLRSEKFAWTTAREQPFGPERFDRQPIRIVGFWSNVAIVQFADGSLGGAFVGTDLLTQHPLGPESILEVPGDVLLRSISWYGEP